MPALFSPATQCSSVVVGEPTFSKAVLGACTTASTVKSLVSLGRPSFVQPMTTRGAACQLLRKNDCSTVASPRTGRNSNISWTIWPCRTLQKWMWQYQQTCCAASKTDDFAQTRLQLVNCKQSHSFCSLVATVHSSDLTRSALNILCVCGQRSPAPSEKSTRVSKRTVIESRREDKQVLLCIPQLSK